MEAITPIAVNFSYMKGKSLMIKTTAHFYPSMTITPAELIARLTFPGGAFRYVSKWEADEAAARGENLIYIKPPIEYSLQIPNNL